ncbi:MAG: phosphodiester glycosidase family protein, partial [Oscillospiraceae bacterium]|nr:phosphodiester glycosidase family protein [Oscillospiraceae bacterium]
MKKSLCARALALLAAAALFSGASASALSRSELLSSQSTMLAKDAVLYSNTMWSETYGDYLHENYIDYFPNTSVVPTVEYGSKLCNYGSFSSMAALLEEEGCTVIAGINGDYYDTSSFCPLGIVIKDGRLISSDAGLNAVGFRADGSVFISRPALKLYLQVDDLNYRLQAVNKVRDGAGMWLYTEDFAATTKSSGAGYDVVLSSEEPLKIGFEADLTVESVSPASGASSIPEGKLLLTVLESDEYFSSVASSLVPGQKLHLSIQSDDERWYEAENAVGSLYKLVTGGGIESGLDNTLNPRTAIGVREDGSMVLYTVDGRRSGYSVGSSMRQTAQRLLELGCTEATLLDGGGSTGMNALYIGSEDYSEVNKASGTSQRSVTNYVMLVSKDNSSAGAASQLGIYPTESLILAGGSMSFTFGAADSSGKKAALPSDASLKASGSIGSVSNTGAFTAGKSAAFGSVTLSAGSLPPASAFVNVITSPDSISVTKRGAPVSSLTLSPGEKIDL